MELVEFLPSFALGGEFPFWQPAKSRPPKRIQGRLFPNFMRMFLVRSPEVSGSEQLYFIMETTSV